MSDLLEVELGDKYTKDSGSVFLTGIQALVRLPMLQHQRDRQAGLDTAGYITGYRGSPLGTYDQQLQAARTLLDANQIKHQPGVNEDLAATACSGTQQAGLDGNGLHDGVFAIWYAKGPGVDRSGDALRHGQLFGTSKNGGVLCLLGDDHTCESSTTAHQSEFAMVDLQIPVLNPAGVEDILRFGLYGIAMSRYTGGFVSLKCVHETVESTVSIDIEDAVPDIRIPEDYELPPGGLNIRWPDGAVAQAAALIQERRVHEAKIEAARAFARTNRFDRIEIDCDQPRLVIATTGKSYLDVIAALEELGLDEAKAAKLGLRLYKIGMTYPLEPQGLEAAIEAAAKVMVVEEKRGLIEEQAKAILYGSGHRPQIIGKQDEIGQTLFQSYGDLNINQVAMAIGSRLSEGVDDADLQAKLSTIEARTQRQDYVPAMVRTPYFCAGCPHNTSTRLPAGSKALAGIGCHFLVQLKDPDTRRFTHMGGEGASWLGEAPYCSRDHVFQNIGDGTYYHSGSMAIRAAMAAGVNITFKILYNDAVAMTGGQKMEIGNLSVADIARDVDAEGVQEIAIVADEPQKYPLAARFPGSARIYHRDELDEVQRKLRATPSVTVLIYDQTCAAEKRRRRKRGTFPDPDKRVFINSRVCEGCGDCGVQSNCVAIQPHETPLGRKRRIDQSACNKDFSCIKGFCPSFVTVHGARIRTAAGPQGNLPFPILPDPQTLELDGSYGIVVTGIGGTGVVTIAALLGMAAHLEKRSFAAIDMIGLAQKNGAVISHLKIAPRGHRIGAPRVASGQADLLLGCDLMVSSGKAALSTIATGRTRVVVNDEETMPGAFAYSPDLEFPTSHLMTALLEASGESRTERVSATAFAKSLVGDGIGANLLILGFALQMGYLPVSASALDRAIEINGVAVPMNKQALLWGRRLAHDPAAVEALLKRQENPELPASQEARIDHFAELLKAYQDEAYAGRYRKTLQPIQALGNDALTSAAAANLYKVMAIKDEYEVARLYTDGSFLDELQAQFENWDRLEFHLAPPLLASFDPKTGHLLKRTFGSWMMRAFRLLARLKSIRGRSYDPFGWTRERREERALLTDYEALLAEIAAQLQSSGGAGSEFALELAQLPASVRGFGHVKEANLKKARERWSELMAQFGQSAASAQAAE